MNNPQEDWDAIDPPLSRTAPAPARQSAITQDYVLPQIPGAAGGLQDEWSFDPPLSRPAPARAAQNTGMPDPNFMERAYTGLKEGFGDQPVGYSNKSLNMPGITGALNRAMDPYVMTADAAVRAIPAVGRGVSGAVSGLFGRDPTEKNQIDRELRNLGNYFLNRAPSSKAVVSLPPASTQLAVGLEQLKSAAFSPFGYGKKRAVDSTRSAAGDLSKERLVTALQQKESGEAGLATGRTNLATSSADTDRIAKTLERYGERQRYLDEPDPKAVPPGPFSAEPRGPSASGIAAQNAYVANEQNIVTRLGAIDTDLRKQVDDIVAGLEKGNVSIGDSKLSKAMLQESRDILRPDVTKAPQVQVYKPTRDRAGVEREIEDALSSSTVSLSADEAKTAIQNGLPVKTIKGSPAVKDKAGNVIQEATPDQYTRTFKTTFEAVDTLRRKFGEAFNGTMRGYDATLDVILRNKYNKLSDIQDDFVKTLFPEMQANWRLLREEQDRLGSGLGKNLLARNKDGTLSANTTQIVPGIIGEGPPGVKTYLAGSNNPQAARALVNDAIESELFGLNTSAQVEKALSPKTNIGEIYRDLPTILGEDGSALKRKVDDYISALKSQEDFIANIDAAKGRIAANVTTEEKALTGASGRVTAAETSIKESGETVTAAKTAIAKEDIYASNLSGLKRNEVLPAVTKEFEDAYKTGQIDRFTYESMKAEVSKAQKLLDNGERLPKVMSVLKKGLKSAWKPALTAGGIVGLQKLFGSSDNERPRN